MNTNELKSVKIYRKVELTQHAIKMIKSEIALMKKLDHPNIMKIHNIIEDEYKIYVITDDIRGPNLFSYVIIKNQLNESDTASIASQLASCIRYLHKHEIIIRRLKLESICFADSESIHELRLTDLLLFNYTDKIKKENPFHLEEAFNPPNSSF